MVFVPNNSSLHQLPPDDLDLSTEASLVLFLSYKYSSYSVYVQLSGPSLWMLVPLGLEYQRKMEHYATEVLHDCRISQRDSGLTLSY